MPSDILDLRGISVLVVEDHPQMRALIVRVLELLRVGTIKEVENANQALQMMKVGLPDILLIDHHMDGMNGIDLARFIRNDDDSPNPYMPIIMISGYGDEETVLDARDSGINEYVAKPLSVAVLGQRLTAVIERARPFVRTREFFGPDRRRRKTPLEGSPRRRSTDHDDVEIEDAGAVSVA